MLQIKTAEEVIAAAHDVDAQTRRQTARRGSIVQAIYRRLLAHGQPVTAEEITAVLPGTLREAVENDLARLDEDDLIQLEDGRVAIAYPFMTRPSPFVVSLEDSRERYACCAIDALGVAPMIGERVAVSGQCHHCGDPLAFTVHPDGPGPEAAGVMVWVGRPGGGEQRAATGL
jgi:hypothetical protein